jgi:inosine-uridine nucleoside N-ribohydrolase
MARIVVDTDLGVDDGAAIAWLLTQKRHEVDLAGVCATWGNTTAAHAAANAIALLRAAGADEVPVGVGAEAPTRSRVGALAHGEDGLWGRAAGTDIERATSDVVGFYRNLAAPRTILLALGPLTNLARVVREDVAVLRRFARIVILGGAKHGGTMTPVSETNFWHDPEAAETVLAARLPITLVTRDAHRICELSAEDITRVAEADAEVMRFLAEPMARYAAVTRSFGEPVTFPDIVAAVVALEPSVATLAKPALVRVIAGRDALTRGQSIIGLSINERLTMIEGGAALQLLIDASLGDPAFDVGRALGRVIARDPDNATVVLEIDAAGVRALFVEALVHEGAR